MDKAFIKNPVEAYEKLKEENKKLKVENEILKEKLVISSNSDKKTLKIIQTLTEIKEIACVNLVNTCWTSLNLCDKCEEKEDCEMQSPFAKLKQILKKCEVIDD